MVPVTLTLGKMSLRSTAMLDSGAISNYIDNSVWNFFGKPVHTRSANPITAIGGSLLAPSTVEALLGLTILDSSHQDPFTVAPIGQGRIILGLPFFCDWKPVVDFEKGIILDLGLTRTSLPSVSLITADEFLREEAISIGLISNSVAPRTVEIPEEYKSYAPLFSKTKANSLPPLRGNTDHAIDLEPDTKPPFGPIYALSQLELSALRSYLDESLASGFIRPSKSPAGAPILFVKKKDGSLRLCVDYRGLNKITIKNRYPLPLISELLDRLKDAKLFTKLDLRGAYNLIRIKAGDEWKTAFRTRYGHFEYMVMPFGLTNAPATFQAYINEVLREHLDDFCVAYLDDILIFSPDKELHVKHVRLVLDKLQAAGLYVKLEKCLFHVLEIDFLGYVLSTTGVSMEHDRVNTIRDWPEPKSVKDVQIFLGFANYYRRFIKRYSYIAGGLTSLLKKDRTFTLTPEALSSFNQLKDAFTSAPFLRHFDPSLPITVCTDASDFAISGILSQTHEKRPHPVAFYSRKLTSAEINYDTGDKEMLAIIETLKHWRHYLEGARYTVRVDSDHKNLETFLSTKVLNRRQARWLMLLSNFNLEIKHLQGILNPADAASRRPDYALGALGSFEGEDELKGLQNSYSDDPKASEIIKKLSDHPVHPWEYKNGTLFHDGLVYIPDKPELRLFVIRSHHDDPLAGHFGSKKTLELITRSYFWPGISADIDRYTRECHICNRAKGPRHAPHGELVPLPPPTKPWTHITMDFIVKLPASADAKFDSILVIVDRLTKMAHFIPCHETDKASVLANYFLRDIVRLHGLPDSIISDRGSTFRSFFWTTLCKKLNINPKFSTSFHPQTDGQTERTNQTLETYLRSYVNYLQNDWADLLPLAEFAYNNASSATTKHSPFFANYGFHPRFNMLSVAPSRDPDSFSVEEHSKRIQDTHQTLQKNILKAQEYQARYYNAKHKPMTYAVGDKVWLLTKNIQTIRPTKKLDHKKLGPYTILQSVGSQSYKLSLPPTVKIHDVFHVSLLEPYHPNTFPNREEPPPPPVVIDDEEEWEVDQILDSKKFYGKVKYLVSWTGYGPERNTWEPASFLPKSSPIIKSFHKKNPTKPKP